MAIINVNDLTIEQLNDLITLAASVRADKVETKRQERENILNNHWDGIRTLIHQYEDNYTIMMRVRDNAGRVKHFAACAKGRINLPLTFRPGGRC